MHSNGEQRDEEIEISVAWLGKQFKCMIMISRKVAKKAKPRNDAIMTGILVTKYKMGQITAGDLERMAKDLSKKERASAAKKVLVGIKGAGEQQEGALRPNPMPKTGLNTDLQA